MPMISAEIMSEISIRAPARGATNSIPLSQVIVLFQSALPRGERLFSGIITATWIYFNPRSREGSDLQIRR